MVFRRHDSKVAGTESEQVVIPRGLIKWHTRKEKAKGKAFNLEISEDSAHGSGIIQVDAEDSGLDIAKVGVSEY